MHTPPTRYFLGKLLLFALFFCWNCKKETTVSVAKSLPDLTNISARLAEIRNFTEKKDWKGGWPLAKSLAEDLLAHPNVPQDSMIKELNRYFFEIGNGLSLDKQFDLTIQSFELELKLVQKRPDLFPLEIGANMTHLGIELGRLGQIKEAIVFFESASTQLEKINLPIADSLLGWNLYLLGGRYLNQSDYREASTFFVKSFEVIQKIQHPQKILPYIYNDLALTYAGSGELSKAVASQKKGLSMIKDPKNVGFYQSYITDQFGGLLMQAGQPKEALIFFRKQQQKMVKEKNVSSSDWSDIWENIGIAETNIGNGKVAEAAFDSSIMYLNEIYAMENPKKGRIFHQKAAFLLNNGDLLAALESNRKAISQYLKTDTLKLVDIEIVGFSSDLFELFTQKATIESRLFEQKKGDFELLKRSVQSFETASNLLDNVRSNFGNARSKMELTANATIFYESAIESANTLFQQTKDPIWFKKAFFFAEKSKSVQLLAASRESGWQNALENAEAQGLDENNADFRAARDSVFYLKNAQRQFLADLKKQFPNYFKSKMDVRVAEVGDIQNALSKTPNSCLVEWFWGRKSCFIFKIDAKNGIRLEENPMTPSLLANVDLVWQTLRTPPVLDNEATVRAFVQQSSLLFETILKPVFGAEKLPENLVFVPDGALARLPLETLILDKIDPDSAISWRKLPYLMQQSMVDYAFSATLFIEKKQPSRASKSLAAFAPDYKNAPSKIASTRGEMTIFPGLRGGFRALENNQPEAQKIAEITKGHAFLAENATETQFKAVAGNFSKLHFAMHALPNDSLPELSQLVFSENGNATDDGRLYAWELCGLPLDADLVSLSACETGVGRVQRGEGVQSLARAFRQAGCPNLVMSLWQANDASTEKIMTDFYQNLAANDRQATALGKAKRVFLDKTEDSRLTHPFFWATFVRIGAANSATSTTPQNWIFGILIAAALCALLYFLFKKRIRSSRI
jgi:CHAT domain-containing protein